MGQWKASLWVTPLLLELTQWRGRQQSAIFSACLSDVNPPLHKLEEELWEPQCSQHATLKAEPPFHKWQLHRRRKPPRLDCTYMWFSLSNKCLRAGWETLKSCLSWEESPLTGSWEERGVLLLGCSCLESLSCWAGREKGGSDLGSNITDSCLSYWVFIHFLE